MLNDMLKERARFLDLHEAIQDAAGWWNYHLFMFRYPDKAGGGLIAGIPSDEDLDVHGEDVPDAAIVSVKTVFGTQKCPSCRYEYDFGDGWLCNVNLIQEIVLPDVFKRKLLDGARAFPHEDCGGISGYERCVEFFKTGKDVWENDPEGLRTWLGGWEPEKFNLERAKKYFDKGKHLPLRG